MGRQKSAEAIVVGVHRPHGLTHRRRAELFEPSGAKYSMSERNVEPQAETPERPGRVGDRIAEGNRHARLADTACNDPARQPIVVTMEEVLSRENRLAAYQRVVGNKGAPGVDGVTVDELEPLICQRWEAIREALFSGTSCER